MQHASFTLAAVAALALAATPANADPAERPPRPYPPVPIVLPAPSPDAAFQAFRQVLAAVAKGRVYSELARLVEPQEFFWARDFNQAFDARKPAVDNLAAAIRLEHADGAGWEALATFAAEESAEPLPSRPATVCAPAPPGYDSIAFARMLAETYGTDLDWAYPRAERTSVRAAPQAGAAAVDTLGLHFVRRLGFDGPGGAGAPSRSRWTRVVTPAGIIGFVAPGSLTPLEPERLCYGKDAVGRWRITGFIAGAN
jgi:hypothetical protein